MKRQGFALWKIIGSFALLLVGTALLMPVFQRVRQNTRSKVGCAPKLKTIAFALAQYSHDWDGHLPRAAFERKTPNATYGWADALMPYVLKNKSEFSVREWVYFCPQGPNDFPTTTALPTSPSYTDYWFNANLSGAATKNIAAPAATITFGDGNYKNDLTDARYSLFALPQTWIDDTSSPAYRHNGGANYAFADGHVKMLKPQQANTMFLPR